MTRKECLKKKKKFRVVFKARMPFMIDKEEKVLAEN